jgi:hypothetical protein
MLKKTLATLFVAATAFTAQAKETITVINPSNKASPGTVFAKSYEESLRKNGKYDVEFYQASSCADANRKFETTKNSVIVVNADVNIAAWSKGIDCPITKKPATLITKSYLKFCRKPDNKKAFGEERTTVGIASVILSQGLFDDLNGNKRKLVGVPYSGSKTVLAAVLAGDVDYGIIGAGVVNEPEQRGEIECVYDYDPRSKKFIGDRFPGLKIPTMPIIQMIQTNSGSADIKSVVVAAGQDKSFLESIEKNGFSDTKNTGITANDVATVESHARKVYDAYWKK